MTGGDEASLGFTAVETTANMGETPADGRLRLAVALSVVLAGVLLLTGCAQVNAGITRLPAVELGEPSFYPTLQAYAGTPIINGNEVQVLLNGEQIFPRSRPRSGARGSRSRTPSTSSRKALSQKT